MRVLVTLTCVFGYAVLAEDCIGGSCKSRLHFDQLNITSFKVTNHTTTTVIVDNDSENKTTFRKKGRSDYVKTPIADSSKRAVKPISISKKSIDRNKGRKTLRKAYGIRTSNTLLSYREKAYLPGQEYGGFPAGPAPAPSFGPGFGRPQPAFGQPQPGFGPPQPNIAQPPPNFNQPGLQSSFSQPSSGFQPSARPIQPSPQPKSGAAPPSLGPVQPQLQPKSHVNTALVAPPKAEGDFGQRNRGKTRPELTTTTESTEEPAMRNRVDLGPKSDFAQNSIREGPRGKSAKLIVAKYNYAPKKDLPLPKCFYNGDGYVCCSIDLNELMVTVYSKLKANPDFHTCNIGAVSTAVQRHSEAKFQTPFEVITGFEDFAQRVHFSGDLVCKIEIDGKFIMAYATPYNAEAAIEVSKESIAQLPPSLTKPVVSKIGGVRPHPRTKRSPTPTFSLKMGPRSKNNSTVLPPEIRLVDDWHF